MPKKSLYLFLTALLGALLFLIIHRVVVFIFLYLILGGYVSTDMSYYQFLALDYFSLIIALMLGVWYGIWLGLYWYKKVYEENSHGGLVHYLATQLFPYKRAKNLPAGLEAIEQRLEADLRKLENLAETGAKQSFQPEPIKRKIVRKNPAAKRKKAVRKISDSN